MAKRRLICIEWLDAEAQAGWIPDVEVTGQRPQLLRTYGLLVRKDKHFVYHASTRDKDDKKWSELGKIPLGMVKCIKTIAVVEE